MTDLSRSVGRHGESGAGTVGGRGVLEGAFALLDVLAEVGEVGLTRLSEAADLPKATVHRLLGQLTAFGAVEKRGDRYRIGPVVFRLGQAWQPDPTLLRAAQGPMLRLARTTGASVGVGIPAYGQVVVVGAVPGESAGRAPMEPGMAWPRFTAAGKVLRAWTSAGTPGAAAMPAAEVARIRAAGVAFDHGGNVSSGVRCGAVPLMGVDADTPVAVLCAMVGAAYPLPRLAAALTRTGAVIAAALP
ncbi:IclR family transcriptional regulator [Embleya sp. AB8]|uniref:IclR family transcriptional regulator n=1 Tax=Embleya sp. AB8 TaxID=3156304 RepID=UPI003C70BD3E